MNLAGGAVIAVVAILMTSVAPAAGGVVAETEGGDDGAVVVAPMLASGSPRPGEIEPLRAPIDDLNAPVEPLRFATATVDGSVVDEGDVFRLDANVFFEFDSAALTPPAAAELGRVAELIRQRSPNGLLVTGHTDSTGADDYNADLSLRRAQTVAAALDELLAGSIDLSIDGAGEDEPIADNDAAEGQARNRRVEIELIGGAE